ncbi:unnamed protein product [Phytophthora lilii]|uniref:Unnamed protein product n=1 Tax=Phytophthora lilii TaxID=2077276 RepID=A0A9W6WYS8_9STRA|nr:unnamed protein product [Phytophthora lilii]
MSDPMNWVVPPRGILASTVNKQVVCTVQASIPSAQSWHQSSATIWWRSALEGSLSTRMLHLQLYCLSSAGEVGYTPKLDERRVCATYIQRPPSLAKRAAVSTERKH